MKLEVDIEAAGVKMAKMEVRMLKSKSQKHPQIKELEEELKIKTSVEEKLRR